MTWQLQRGQPHFLHCTLGTATLHVHAWPNHCDVWVFVSQTGADTKTYVKVWGHYFQKPGDARTFVRSVETDWPRFLDDNPDVEAKVMEYLV